MSDAPFYSDIVGDLIHGYPVIAVVPGASDPKTEAVILLEKGDEFVTGWIYSNQYADGHVPQGWAEGEYIPFNAGNKHLILKLAILNMATRAARIRY